MSEIVVDDVVLHYQCFGEGENLVLIHGLGANLAFWYPGIASTLSQHYRVILYDLRGHGKSSMPTSGYTIARMTRDLHALLEHLGVTRLHVVGHSFGARIAVQYAILYPHQVATLTVADSQFRCLQPRMRLREWSYWKTWKQQLEQKGIPLPSEDEFISFHLLKHLNQISLELTQGSLAKSRRGPSLKSRDMGKKGAARWEQLLETTTAKQEFEEGEQITQEDIKTIAIPTLAIYGEYSHCLASCGKLKELIGDCQVVIHPKVGHFHPVVRPKLFLETLGQFLQTHPLNARNPEAATSLLKD
jgi:pimeloyl-ACP methyl ester carboxylesterase